MFYKSLEPKLKRDQRKETFGEVCESAYQNGMKCPTKVGLDHFVPSHDFTH